MTAATPTRLASDAYWRDRNTRYNPMPPRPLGWEQMVAIIRAEYLAELPVRIHVSYVPNRPEPIAVGEYTAGAAGYATRTMFVTDTGELGSPSWAPAFHRRVGAVTGWGEEIALNDGDMVIFPWARQLEGVRRWCASRHRTWYEHQMRPLCWLLLRHVVLGGYSIERAADLEGVSPEKALALLAGHVDCDPTHRGRCETGALGRWWRWVSNDLNGVDTRRSFHHEEPYGVPAPERRPSDASAG